MDIDNDGDLDLLVGEKYESVHYYQRQIDGSLKEQPLLIKVEKPDPNLAYMSISPSFADWNGDGALDVILGSDVYKSGLPWPLRLYANKGSAANPVYSTYDTLRDKNGKVIQIDCARTVVGDLDKDGKNDLLVGNRKVTVYWYKNTGSNSKPVFEEVKLIPNTNYGIAESPDFEQMAGFGYATPRIYDWNKDKKPDLLLSGYPSGKILIYLNQAATPVETVGGVAATTLAVYRSETKIALTFRSQNETFASVRLIDMRGRIVITKVISSKESGYFYINIECGSIVQGLFIVEVETAQSLMSEKVLFTR